MFSRVIILTLVLTVFASSAFAAASTIEVDTTNTIPNVIANALIADGEGADWMAANLQIDLAAGSIYNDPGFDSDFAQASLWGFVPLLRWDSAVGIANDGSSGVGGAAVCPPFCGSALNLSGTGPLAANISWFNTAVGDTTPVQIGNISLTDDAAGTWSMITSFTSGNIEMSGPVVNGVMVPEPASFALLGLAASALLRRTESPSGMEASC